MIQRFLVGSFVFLPSSLGGDIFQRSLKVWLRAVLQGFHSGHGLGFIGFTCIPKPYKIVGYDPLITGFNPENGRFLDAQVGFISLKQVLQGQHRVLYCF